MKEILMPMDKHIVKVKPSGVSVWNDLPCLLIQTCVLLQPAEFLEKGAGVFSVIFIAIQLKVPCLIKAKL
ncbi:hypothetical protein [Bacillus atrophaeus]|uniref:hypothetical protein n=1 Tax=Bacillus atrophaeus TaxID=1452 RepID=UPI002E1EA30E|nr:hypothetical protein [Bacillus atrophaeus]